ncbi:hypothetical protein ACF068_00300 [Streptomyces sp. NPDC016309]|uniref:hypothetical protein n=1 Tax=Streptomyces sp. NPDC016309 TaxID=3364965 RepID=UPI003700EB91
MTYTQRWQELLDLAPGPGTLTHSGGPWTAASGTAGELRVRTEGSRRSLGTGHHAVRSPGTGLASVASLQAVLTSWEERLALVRDECAYLTGALSAVAKELGETDTGVGQAVGAVRTGGRER